MFNLIDSISGINKKANWLILILKQDDDSGRVFTLHKSELYYGRTILEAEERVRKFNETYSNSGYTASFRRAGIFDNDYNTIDPVLRP